jgi:hypothetical protein
MIDDISLTPLRFSFDATGDRRERGNPRIGVERGGEKRMASRFVPSGAKRTVGEGWDKMR